MISNSAVETEDTIIAIATALAPAKRGAIRLTGPDAIAVVEKMGIRPLALSPHFVESYVDLGEPLGRVPIRALLWPGKASYTGQPSAELHTYGCLPILRSVIDLGVLSGARVARPGEFTLRAFLAGRIDLTQAEAVLGVIDAEQRGSLDHALRQLGGNLSKPLEQLRSELLDLLADVEAGLDFVDEDIQFIRDDALAKRLKAIADLVAETGLQLAQRDQSQSVWVVALRGLPNAGKSRLLNAIAASDVAIVAGVAGTTRDAVSVSVSIDGVQFRFIDTAGIEDVGRGNTALDEIAMRSQEQSQQAGEDADVRLWCVDWGNPNANETAEEVLRLAKTRRRSAVDFFIATKADQSFAEEPPEDWHRTSALSYQSGSASGGIEVLKRVIVESVRSLDRQDAGSVVGTAARCGGSLQAAETAIRSAINCVASNAGHEFVAADIRSAIHSLGEVTGAVYTDDLLDRVFSRFCIGK
ncbi:MAG: tRNA modification GTPase [Planctomycetota bacterium]